MTISDAEFLAAFRYDPETGKFYWAISGWRIREGTLAGSVDTKGYVWLKYKQRRILAHRVAYFKMLGEWPPNDIDHDDGVRSNNKWSNLLSATKLQNAANQKFHRENPDKPIGVRFDRGLWTASFRSKSLGGFATESDAIAARKAAEAAYSGSSCSELPA